MCAVIAYLFMQLCMYGISPRLREYACANAIAFCLDVHNQSVVLYFGCMLSSLMDKGPCFTGVPTKRSHPYRRESSPPDTRQTRSKMTRSASLGSTLTRSHAAPPCPSAKKEHVELEVSIHLASHHPFVDELQVESVAVTLSHYA